jgi:Regulator of chromosome condensation (RCC1) repeat
LDSVVAVAGGYAHSLALKSDGTVMAWGYNIYGQLGIGTFADTNQPIEVAGLCQPVISVNEIAESFNMDVFPNPTSGTFTIKLSSALYNGELEIFNACGTKVFVRKMNKRIIYSNNRFDEYFFLNLLCESDRRRKVFSENPSY